MKLAASAAQGLPICPSSVLSSSGVYGEVPSLGCPLAFASESLNTDPYNTRAEEQALMDCTLGVEVRRTWSEKEMVRSIDGRYFPSTPDGMFETWDGSLICVQVVRVPLVLDLSPDAIFDTLAQTVLAKVVKSQSWLCASHVVPQDIVIFCWLPFPISDSVAESAYHLMQQVRIRDPRFSLRLRVPAEANALFPALFACNHEYRQRSRIFSSSDVATAGSDTEDDDEACSWDITWLWEQDFETADCWGVQGLIVEEPTSAGESSSIATNSSDEFGCDERRGYLQDGDGQLQECEGSFGVFSEYEHSLVWQDAG